MFTNYGYSPSRKDLILYHFFLPILKPKKGISFWVKGLKERRQNFELFLKQEPLPPLPLFFFGPDILLQLMTIIFTDVSSFCYPRPTRL